MLETAILFVKCRRTTGLPLIVIEGLCLFMDSCIFIFRNRLKNAGDCLSSRVFRKKSPSWLLKGTALVGPKRLGCAPLLCGIVWGYASGQHVIHDHMLSENEWNCGTGLDGNVSRWGPFSWKVFSELCSALKPVWYSDRSSRALDFQRLKIIWSMTLMGRLIRLIVLWFFFGLTMNNDWINSFGHYFCSQIVGIELLGSSFFLLHFSPNQKLHYLL